MAKCFATGGLTIVGGKKTTGEELEGGKCQNTTSQNMPIAEIDSRNVTYDHLQTFKRPCPNECQWYTEVSNLQQQNGTNLVCSQQYQQKYSTPVIQTMMNSHHTYNSGSTISYSHRDTYLLPESYNTSIANSQIVQQSYELARKSICEDVTPSWGIISYINKEVK